MRRLIPALGALALLAACGTGGPPPSLLPSASAAPVTARPSDGPPTVAATERPTSAPTSSAPASPASAAAWEMSATFDVAPGTSYVTDIVNWSGGWLAIGSAWESEYRVNGEMPAMWMSDDGRSWRTQPTELGVDDVTLLNVVARADGRLLLVGRVPGSGAMNDPAEPGNVAWLSENAMHWEPVELPVSDNAIVISLDHGPKGYVLSAQTPYVEFDPNADPTPGELWFSVDGIAWTKTHEGAVGAVAGEEGFIAIQSALAAGPSAVVASADGKTWYPSDPFGAPLFDVAAVGGDWVATAAGSDPGTIQVLHSEDGLAWTPVLDVNDLTGPDGPKTGRGLDELAISSADLAGGNGYAFLMLGNNHCCAQMGWTHGAWVTTDGVTWTEAIPGGAFVSSVAAADGVTVLGGHVGRGEDPTFWVAE